MNQKGLFSLETGKHKHKHKQEVEFLEAFTLEKSTYIIFFCD